MDCKGMEKLRLRLPEELAEAERRALESHVRDCSACAAEWRLAGLARRIGSALPVLEPSPFFATRVLAGIREESQGAAPWQAVLALSRHMIPALAAVTLLFISIFAYTELSPPAVDLYQTYESMFSPAERTQLTVIADPGGITDESIMRALAEEDYPMQLSKPQLEPRRD